MKQVSDQWMALVVLMVASILWSQPVAAQKVLTTNLVGGSLSSDAYGRITNLTVGLNPPFSPKIWYDLVTSFVIVNDDSPVELADGNLVDIANLPELFQPGRFADYTTANAYTNVLQRTTATYDVVFGFGIQLYDPSPSFGYPYIEFNPAFQFTNVGAAAMSVQGIRYFRHPEDAAQFTVYAGHNALGLNDYDGVDGTADDYAIFYDANRGLLAFSTAGLTPSHYRIQENAGPGANLYDEILGAGAHYSFINSTVQVGSVANPKDGEAAWMYGPYILGPNEALIMNYPGQKLLHVYNPTLDDIDYEERLVNGAGNHTFAGTDVAMSFSFINFVNGNLASEITVIELTGGMVSTPIVDDDVNHVSDVRHWDITPDTRAGAFIADITFAYDPAVDNITNENNIRLLWRPDSWSDWSEHSDIVLDPAANTITANDANDFGQWALGEVTGLRLFGHVNYFEGARAVSDVDLSLSHGQGNSNGQTDANGDYEFNSLQAGAVTLIPSKSGDLRNAISGADALLSLQQLAFIAQLSSDQAKAADVDESGAVDGADALALLRYLALFNSHIGNTGAWVFTPADSQFNLNADAQVDFTAFLLGDVNGSWNGPQPAPAPLAKGEGAPHWLLQLLPASSLPEGGLAIPVFLESDGSEANTLVLTVEYDVNALRYRQVEKTAPASSFMLAANGERDGKIHVAMAGVQGIQSSGNVLLLVFDPVQASGSPVDNEVWLSRAAVNDIELEVGSPLSVSAASTTLPVDLHLSQNYPNPFNAGQIVSPNAVTTIRYSIPNTISTGAATILRIYNTQGQAVRTLIHANLSPGWHQVDWNGLDDSGAEVPSGTYFYSLSIGDLRATRKLLILR